MRIKNNGPNEILGTQSTPVKVGGLGSRVTSILTSLLWKPRKVRKAKQVEIPLLPAPLVLEPMTGRELSSGGRKKVKPFLLHSSLAMAQKPREDRD